MTENPKEKFGQTKPQLHLVPPAFLVYTATAFRDGARKYGPYNWRENAVIATTYVSAAQRHLASWFDGEELAEDSGVHHLAHAAACLAILIDCIETGNLKDDRPAAGNAAALIKRLTVEDAPAPAPERERFCGFGIGDSVSHRVKRLNLGTGIITGFSKFSDGDPCARVNVFGSEHMWRISNLAPPE